MLLFQLINLKKYDLEHAKNCSN